MGKVVCTAVHPVDLDDGRSLAPGETADDVDTEAAHNRGLVLDGSIVVLEGTVPRVRHEEELVKDAQNALDNEEDN